MHSPLPRLPVILLQVHDKAAQHLKNELHVLFNNADETLFEMADKAQSDAEQSLYFEAMRDVRLKRKNIERGFLERLFFAFIKLTQPDISESAVRRTVLTQNASPLMFNEWERDQVINAMVAQVLTRDQLALCQLTSRLNTLCWVTLNEHTNPLGPAMLCEYFLEAERDQGIDLKVKLIMLQLFEKYLLSQTPRLYADANQLLVATGILPELSAATSCCSSNKAPRGKKSEVAGEDVGHLVGKLFDYISSDRHLAPPLKKLMSQLQEPMLKIALLDQQFFSNDSHPARCLLNVMADAAMGWDDTGDVRNDPLYKEIERVVKQLEHCSCVGTPESLESVLQDFVRFAHAERGVVERLEQRIRTHELLQVKTSGSVLSGLPSALDEQDRLGLLLVSQLRIGTWIELQATSTRRQRCKLITILEPEGLHVFVNRHGLKVVEKSRCDLIVQLRNGTISLLDDRLLFDRALASMIANLGQYSAH